MSWSCAAIDHGLTIFPDGRVGPCCQIGPEYLKPIDVISDPNRFQDLKTDNPPDACRICINNEKNQIPSYRQQLNQQVRDNPGIQFLDIRNTNFCNLKCRYCGPHFSNQWATELGHVPATVTTPIEHLIDDLVDTSLQWIYFTGGEPLINPDHWTLLNKLVERGISDQIGLLYNTNLTTIKYKNLDIFDLWQKFRSVSVNVSVDAIGQPLSYIRSGSDWNRISHNLDRLRQESNLNVTLTPVVSILNLWFLKELYEYAKQKNFSVDAIILHGPDYLAIDVVPDDLKSKALDIIKALRSYGLDISSKFDRMEGLVQNNINHCLFQHTISHILLLDQRRGEKLFDILPFAHIAQRMILENNEYR